MLCTMFLRLAEFGSAIAQVLGHLPAAMHAVVQEELEQILYVLIVQSRPWFLGDEKKAHRKTLSPSTVHTGLRAPS